MGWRENLEIAKDTLVQMQSHPVQSILDAIDFYKDILENLESNNKQNTSTTKTDFDNPKSAPAQNNVIPRSDLNNPINNYSSENTNPTVKEGFIVLPFVLKKLLEHLPDRKLPKEENGTGYKTPAGTPIAINTALQNHEFGSLLWNPLSEETIKIEDLMDQDVDYRLEVALDKGMEKLTRSLVSDQYSIWDRSAYALPTKLEGLKGKYNLGVGIPYLMELATIYRADSERALIQIHDFIPSGIEVIPKNLPTFDPNFSDLEAGAEGGAGDSNGLNTNTPGLNIAPLKGLNDIIRVLVPDKNTIVIDSQFGFLGNLPPLFNQDRDEYESNKEDEDKLIEYDFDSKTYKINSYVDFILYLIQEFDALIGQFPNEIEIKDEDLKEEGDQTKIVKLGNISEALTEIYGLLTINSLQTDVNLNILTRFIGEILRIRNLNFNIYDIVKANKDFLGYREKERKLEISSNFSVVPEKGELSDYSKLLTERTDTIKGVELDPDTENLQDFLTRFMFTCGIVKNALTKPATDLTKLANLQAMNDVNTVDDFDTFGKKINNEESWFNLMGKEKQSKIYYQYSDENTKAAAKWVDERDAQSENINP